MSFPFIGDFSEEALRTASSQGTVAVHLRFGKSFPLGEMVWMFVIKLKPIKGHAGKCIFVGWNDRIGGHGKVNLFICWYDLRSCQGYCFFLKNQHIACLKQHQK